MTQKKRRLEEKEESEKYVKSADTGSGITYPDWREVPWDKNRWPNFSPGEPNLACPLTGQFYFWPLAFDCLQGARNIVGEPFVINSGHRSPIHNAMVGGKPLSQHKKIAFDISTLNHDRVNLYEALKQSGFTGFGFYQTFIHADLGRERRWFGGKLAEKIWTSLGIS